MNSQIHSLFPSSLIILNLFILIVTTRSESSLHESHDSCAASFTCGTISGIQYPFSRLEYPQYCGYPGLELNCVGKNSPSIDINNMTYHVLSINQTSQLLKIVREDVIESVCPHEFVNTTIDHELFDQTSSYTNITFLYGCEENLNNLYSLSCDDNGIDRVLVSHGEQGPGSCNQSVVIPVPDTAIRSVNSTGLGQLLRGGFEVRWKVDMEACNECTQSSGLCRYDHDTRRTSCTTARIGSSTKTRSLTIVLPIAVAILVATGIGSGLFLYRKRRKTRSIRSHEAPINHVVATGLNQRSLATNFPACIIKTSSTTTQLGNSSYFGTRVFTYEELESATDGFNDSQELGDGGFGTVYYGKLPDGQEIAVKRLHKHSFKRVEQFTNEVEILTMLRHKNLVKLYGCTSRRSRELLLVYEYIPNGTLADHLHGKLANPGWLDWSMRVNIAIETAEALTYLHESDIIHRDVKTSNILLDDNYGVKVADFGLSRLFPGDVTHVSTAPQGTPGYVDPEYYQCYRLTEKSDVYSFGVVLMELISSLMAVDTGRDRFEVNLANMAVDKIQNGRLGELVDRRIGFECGGFVRRTVSLVAELGFRCLLPEKEMRPAMAEVVESLRGIWKEGVNAQSPEVVDVVADDGGGPPLLESGAAGDLV